MDVCIPYIPGTIEYGSILAWRMPLELSQSRLGGRTQRSSACTLIALKVAELLYRSNTRIDVPELDRLTWIHNTRSVSRIYVPQDVVRCPLAIIQVLTEAIISGNELHEKFLHYRLRPFDTTGNFTIPEALAACGHNFHEVDFCAIDGRLWTILPSYLKFAINNPELRRQPRLFFMMIAFERCVLLVYDRYSDTVSLFDTHMHREQQGGGAIVAVCEAKKLRVLADWMSENIFPETVDCVARCRTEHQFELSLLTFGGQLSPSDCMAPWPSIPRFNLFDAAHRNPKRIFFPPPPPLPVVSPPVKRRPPRNLVNYRL